MYYGWVVVAVVFLAQLFQVGFSSYTFGLLVPSVQTEFDASRAEIMMGMSLTTVAGLVLAPLLGGIIDRYSARLLMTIGTLAMALGLYALSVSPSMLIFTLSFGFFMALANGLMGTMVGTPVVSRWFTKSRGKALGIAAVGTSVGGLFLPWFFTHLLDDYGWRQALQYLAITLSVILLPLTTLVLRSSPTEEQGKVEGIAPQSESGLDVLAASSILKEPAFWLIGVSLGLIMAIFAASMANLPVFAIGLGVAKERASTLIMLLAGFGLLGKIIFGYASDKISLKHALWVTQVLVAIAMLMYSTEPSWTVLCIASAIFGLASGGLLPVWGAMVAQLFGAMHTGRVMGFMGPVITLTVMPSFPLAGYIFDQTGSYTQCFLLFAGLAVAAAIIVIPLRMPNRG